ncbi:MAG: acyl carrier protein [Thermodesulfovibrionales bacterium]
MTVKDIEHVLIRGIASITAKDEFSIAPDLPLHQLGIDSMGFVEILVYIEKTFKLQLIESDLTKKDFETIHSLASLISKQL